MLNEIAKLCESYEEKQSFSFRESKGAKLRKCLFADPQAEQVIGRLDKICLWAI